LGRDNYGFAKRQRELAKKKKKEEKRQRKLAKQNPEDAENPEAVDGEAPVSEGVAESETPSQGGDTVPPAADPLT